MDAKFWHQRWQENRIGFHQEQTTPLLEAHWPSLDLPTGSQVFVPLCGKTRDIDWLAARGHRVLGVELSEIAVQQFFAERELNPAIIRSPIGTHFSAGPVELIQSDIFAITADTLANCSAVFDRAALIALPPQMRMRYADVPYARLPPTCQGLLITLEYPQPQMDGPPFSVAEAEVHALFDREWNMKLLERRDILAERPDFAEDRVTALNTAAYRFERRQASDEVRRSIY